MSKLSAVRGLCKIGIIYRYKLNESGNIPTGYHLRIRVVNFNKKIMYLYDKTRYSY